MNHAQASALTAKITALTVQHMADEAGITADAALAAIIEGGAARARFNAFLAVAAKELAA